MRIQHMLVELNTKKRGSEQSANRLQRTVLRAGAEPERLKYLLISNIFGIFITMKANCLVW